MSIVDRLNECVYSVREKINFIPRIALVLGSGLGDYADGIRDEHFLSYDEIKGFPRSTVLGHKGRFVFGYIKDTPVVIMQGRVHYYEGYDMKDVVLPIRLMVMLGAKAILLTNASGSINISYKPGDLMLITDHIASLVPSPLIGPNIDELGLRFPDMSEVYSKRCNMAIRAAAQKLSIPLKDGVYIQTSGPNFETPHEIRAYRNIGADAVGMSTACEAIAARHMGVEVCGISLITNNGSGVTDQPLTDQEVYDVAAHSAPAMKQLLTAAVIELDNILQEGGDGRR